MDAAAYVMSRVMAALLLLAGLSTACGAAAGSPNAAAESPNTTAEPADHAVVTAADLAAAPLPVLPAPTPQLPTTVTSTDGTTVEVTDVTRILPLSGGVAEIVFTLGFGEQVIGRDEQATFAEAAHLPVVTSSHAVSAEGVLSLAPTLVIGDTLSGPPEALDAIRGAGVPVVLVPETWTLEEIPARVDAVAAALGVPGAGQQLLDQIDRSIAEVTAAAPADGPTVAFLYLRGTAGVYLLGGDGSGADALIEAAGGVDAGSAMGLQPFTPLTSEALVAAAPDVLLVMTLGLESVGGMDGLLEVPGIAQTPAGTNRRIVVVDDGLLLAFGARTPAVVAYIATQLMEVMAP